MIGRVAKVRVLLGALVVLISALLFAAGCGQGSEQSQALEEEQQKNQELQEKLEAQEEQQQEAERQQEAQEREELQQENEELKEENEELQEQESELQETNPPEQESDSPEVVIESNEDWTAPPSQAAEGLVVVSPDYDVQAVSTEEAQVLDAAFAYYQEVEVGDYYATHSLLSTYDQDYFPVSSWVEANTTLDSAAGEFVVTDAYPEDIGNGIPTYAVTLMVYLPDGSASPRKTYFADEGNGFWAHWLTEEEMDLFNGAL